MDFQDRGESQQDANLLQGQDSPVEAGASETRLAAGQEVVVLPPGATLENLVVEGRDLVIQLEDGTRIVIPDGAVFTPQIVVEGVAIPPFNIAQLLTGNEPEPAAGAPRSSGGNFAEDEGAIQDAYDLGDLLPYTTFAFPEDREEEIIPDIVDRDPDVVIETPDNPAGVENAIATVDEEGLPERGEPSEPEGTNEAGNGETASGTIVFDAPDGLSAILINGVAITQVGQTFSSPYGTLTITSIDLANGEIGFSYTLEDNTLGEEQDGFFEVTVIDADGDQATASLAINIVDDGPIAADDIGIVPAGSHAPITGSVLANDVSGADDYATDGAVTGFSAGEGTASPGESVQGEYGVLMLNADGSYTYVRDFDTPGGVEDSFTYTIVDQDGSVSTAELVIQIGDAPGIITSVPETGEGTVVDEGGLPDRSDEPAGTGEIADGDGTNDSDESEATGATITFNSPDGVASVTINGVAIDPANLPQTIIQNGGGTLVITGFTYDPVTGDGSIDYEFTLGDNTDGDDTSFEFTIELTDLDGDVATDTLTIDVIDDTPEAVDDSALQGAENAPVTVDVFANDTPGADDVALDAIALVPGSLTGLGSVAYNGDGSFTYTPAPGEEGTVSFDYSITDGDGDVSTATVTITLLEDSTPDIAVEGDNDVAEAGLPARADEPAGSDAASDSEIATGAIGISTGNDTVASLVINGVDVTGGGTVATAKGELVVTFAGGTYSYSYTLTDNTLSDPDSDSFSLTVTDSDGDTADTTLVIAILDDTPSAEDDGNAIGAGEYGPVGGNVLSNDTQGADGATVTSYSGFGGSGAAGTTVQGEYGTLSIAADGTYSYTRDPGTPGGVSDTFTYTITDGDGDIASADLVITIADSGTMLDLPAAGEDGTIVEEAGLAGPPAGSDAASDTEFTTGTFTFAAPDGPAIVTIDGVAVTAAGQTFTGTFGTLTIDSIADGSITYSYELATNTDGDDTFDEFVVRVTDQDGDFSEDTLEIAIVDDTPTAAADADAVTEDGPLTADGNVITGSGGNDANDSDGVADVTGADGASVTGVAAGSPSGPVTGTVGVAVTGSYGDLTVAADGSYSYALDNDNPLVQGLDGTETLTDIFTYTITDGDGDTSTTTITVTIDGSDDPITIEGLDGDGAEQTLFENDLADGSSPDAGALTKTGSFSITSQDGLDTLTVGGVIVYDAASATTYPVTIDDPVYGLLTITGVAVTTDANGDVVAATVSYSYVLEDNSLLHTGGNDGSFTDSFEVVATDSDGSSDVASLDITVVDDVPTARDDSAGQVAENQSIEIDTFVNDTFGADGVDTGDPTKVFVSSPASQGSVSYDPTTGTFTYTPAPGAGSEGNLTDSFEYTIIDADGDASTARVDITLQPDSEPTGGTREATVDDDGLAGNNPLSQTGDLDANIGDDPADTSEASFTGTLAFDVGNDGPASIGFDPALEGATTMVGQEEVTFAIDGDTLTATGPRGVLFTVEISDSATGGYVVTLLDNVLHEEGGDENDAAVSIDFLVEDSEGDTATTTLDIVFDDDAPTATDNVNSVTEGGNVGGNALTDDDGDGVDAAGADGFALDGAIVRIDSVNEGTNDTGVDGSGNLVLAGEFGTLTINTVTGVYSYQSNANSTNVDAQDVFTYTIADGDGDESTATLTIDIDNVAGEVSDNDVLVNEAGLPQGSDPDSDSEIDADGQITVVGASGTLVYTLLSPADGTYGTLVLDPDTGAYTYTLDTPFTDAVDENGANTVNGAESFDYEVRDTLGNLIGTGSISVNIVDDIPTATDQASVSVAEDALAPIGGNVVTDGTPDTEGADGATVTAIIVDGDTTDVPQDGTTATVVTAKGTYTIDMDGNWTFDPNPNLDQSGGDVEADFDYTLTDGDGDTSTATQPILITDGAGPMAGPDIDLVVDDQNLADGSTPGTDDFDSDSIVFTEGSDDIVSIIFDDGPAALDNLGGGLTWVRDSDTQVTGYDGARPVVTLTLSVTGTTATVTATLVDNYDDHPGIDLDDLVDLGSIDVVASDIDGDTARATVGIDVSDDLPTVSTLAPPADALTVDESDLSTDDTADFSGLFVPDYNADNPGAIGGYVLGINPGPTGLVDTLSGEAVVLVLNGAVVEGRTETGDVLVFTVSVDSDGVVTLDQQRAVEHADDSDPNDPTGFASADLITLSATVTDSDDDTDMATVGIAGAITFLDDGPALSDVAIGGGVDVDETDGLPQSDTSTTAIISYTPDFGADGDGGATFTITVSDPDSGLATADGDFPITLVQVDATTIEGRYDGGNVAFEVKINADGTVTLTQNVALEHLEDGDDSLGEYNDVLDLAGKIGATVTIEDGDGDPASETIDIGSALAFFDDGPSVTLSANPNSLTVSDTDLGSDSENFADGFVFDGGEDGTANTSYALSVADGAFSGLYDAVTNEQIFLFLEGGEVVGRHGTDAGDAATGGEVFRVTVDASGNVTLDLSRAIDHLLSGGDGSTATLLADGLIQLTATITDQDGDFDTATLDIGQDLAFTDDTPTAAATLEALLDDDTQGGNAGGPDDQSPDTANTSGTLVDPIEGFGNDGGSAAFDLGSTLPSGFRLVADPGSDGVLIQQEQGPGNWITVVTVTLDASNGAYTVAQNANILHEDDAANEENEQSFTLSAILTDGDGDTDTTSLTITVDDDTPEAVDDGEIASVDDNANGVSVGTVATLTGNDDYGADGAGNPAITIGTGSLGGTIAIVAGNLVYTSATDIAAPYADQLETFTYTITDGDGDTTTATFQIRLTDEGPAIAADSASFTVDEDGLPGGIAGGDGDVAGEITVRTGNLAGLDFGVDGAGDIVLTAVADIGLMTLAGNAIETEWDGSSHTLTGKDAVTGTIIFTLEITDVATGAYRFELLQPVKHPTPGTEDDLSFTVGVVVTDAENETANGTISITVDDDSPVAVVADDLVMTNAAGASQSADLDADGNVGNNFGADGGMVIFTQESIDALVAQGLTSGFAELSYTISNGGTVITATKTSDGSEVFRIELEPSGGDNLYSVTVTQPLDATSDIDFNGGNYNFVGGNNAWNGFVPLGESLGGTTIDNDSRDLLLTPAVNGADASSVNTTATIGGIGNTFVGSQGGGETFRVDFVTDLRGTNNGVEYSDPTLRDHVFDGHYTVNGATALFKSSSGSTVRITAFDDSDGNNVVGDGTIDPINGVTISYLGVSFGSIIIPTATPTNYIVNGRTFTVTLNGDGSVSVAGVAGASGSSLQGTVIGVFTATGYNSVEYSWEAGSTFQIGDFGATTITDDPIVFNVPISVIDGDGDLVESGDLDITLDPAPPIMGGGSQGTQSFSTSSMLIEDTSDYTNPGNDNGTGPIGGSVSSMSFHNAARTSLRSNEFSTVAAMSGAFLLNEAAGAQATGDFGLAANDGMFAATAADFVSPSVAFSGIAPNVEVADLLAFESGPTALHGTQSSRFEPDPSGEGIHWSQGTQAAPERFELLIESDPDMQHLLGGMSTPDAGSNVGQAMEALLMLDPQQVPELLDGAALTGEAAVVLDDIANENLLDRLIAQLEEPAELSDFLDTAAGVPEQGLLDAMVDASIGLRQPLHFALDQLDTTDAATTQA